MYRKFLETNTRFVDKKRKEVNSVFQLYIIFWVLCTVKHEHPLSTKNRISFTRKLFYKEKI